MAVDVDRQRMIVTPVLRLIFSLTSLVDTPDFFEVGPQFPFFQNLDSCFL